MKNGLFQEQIIKPVSIEESNTGKATFITDESGQVHTVHMKGARSSLFLYLRNILRKDPHIVVPLTRPAMWAWSPERRTGLMNYALEQHQKQGTPRTFKLIFNDKGEVIAITTDQHVQIPYTTIATAVEKAIQKVIPDAEFTDRGLDRYWTYKLPVESKFVNTHVGIDAGLNRPRGRCAIYIYTRMEVIWTGQNGRAAPCKNWAYWKNVGKFFNINFNKSLFPKIYNRLANLSAKTVHTSGSEIKSDDIEVAIKNIIDNADIIDPVIEDSMRIDLHANEIDAILEAYQDTVGLPKYAIEAIRENVVDLDLWGLSNAVSYFRTHGELRNSKTANREARSIINVLENISGELLTLGPAIKLLKEKLPNNRITKAVLLNPNAGMFSKDIADQLQFTGRYERRGA